ncbi:AAA family ATPase [Actinophytocola sp.]|uniref:AAA family ATPase n=1 Tax=Actinophytocola sp. TaxID=1872138 RepID=UPI002ED2D59E
MQTRRHEIRTARLILLNGPPGCGKSTVARRYVDEHPLALNLDIDHVRGLIGRWRDDPHTAGLLAREIALAAARVHLVAGHDVVVPQFLGRLTFIEQLERLAGDVVAAFHEVVLLDSKENTLRRFTERSRLAVEPGHVDAQELLDRSGGLAELSAMYDRLVSIVGTRPGARVVPVVEGDVDLTYAEVVRALG